MNNQQKQQVQYLRYSGLTYSQIAGMVGLSPNTVKSFCLRKGIRPKAVANRAYQEQLTGMSGNVLSEGALPVHCAECGQQIEQRPKVKPRRFCSSYCRHIWWNKNRDQLQHKAIYYLTCEHCGRDFESYGNQHRKYCSRDCYIEARYG